MSEAEAFIRRRRRRRGRAPEPEAEAKPREGLVAQGPRGHAPPKPAPTVDDALRDAARGRHTVWRPVG